MVTQWSMACPLALIFGTGSSPRRVAHELWFDPAFTR